MRVAKETNIVKMTCQAICLRYSGNSTAFEMKPTAYSTKLNTRNIPKSYKRTKGNGELCIQHEFVVDNMTLCVYAWSNGEAGDENKHELPPPIDKNLYFGNSYILAFDTKKNQIDVSLEDYEKLGEVHFGGFDDVGSVDSWSTEEELSDTDSLHNFIVDG